MVLVTIPLISLSSVPLFGALLWSNASVSVAARGLGLNHPLSVTHVLELFHNDNSSVHHGLEVSILVREQLNLNSIPHSIQEEPLLLAILSNFIRCIERHLNELVMVCMLQSEKLHLDGHQSFGNMIGSESLPEFLPPDLICASVSILVELPSI